MERKLEIAHQGILDHQQTIEKFRELVTELQVRFDIMQCLNIFTSTRRHTINASVFALKVSFYACGLFTLVVDSWVSKYRW